MSEEPLLSMLCGTDDGAGADVLHILAKRTYDILPNGQCKVAAMQVPLQFDELYYENKGQGGAAPPCTESDLMCNGKPGTDVVIQGKAHVLGEPRPMTEVSVAILTAITTVEEAKKRTLRIRVIGDRKVEFLANGQVRFSAPEPFSSMDLTYDRAYGGRDLWAEKTHPDPLVPFLRKYSDGSDEPDSKYLYHRNPAGTGYLVYPNEEAFEQLKLPNLEHPNDLLTPERLCLRDQDHWHLAPLPVGFDWISVAWFPRSAWLGATPQVSGKPTDLPEVQSGLLPRELVDLPDGQLMPILTADHMARFCHGASPWLQTPSLSGAETIMLQGFHQHTERMMLALPRERPHMYLAPPSGAARELTPALKTVVVNTEANRLVMLWSGAWAADRPLTEGQQEKVRHSVRWPG